MWLNKAIKEAPYLREPYVEMALLEYKLSNWKEVIEFCDLALSIEKHNKSYINEPFSWDHTIYDLLAISCYNLKKYNYAVYFNNIALQISKDNERLKLNHKIYLEKEKVS